MQVHPYLTFNGNCAEAFKFYEKTLSGKLVAMQTHGESPMAAQTPPSWHDAILHARLDFGATTLMGSDRPPGKTEPMQGFSVSLLVDSAVEAEKVFAALSEGGQVSMPLQQTFWAVRFGMCTDRFGVAWMVNCAQPAT